MAWGYIPSSNEKRDLNKVPFFVIRLGFEPKTPTLKVLCSTN